MFLSAHQPTFIPWLGFFHKLAVSDLFVIFDAVQFEYHEFGNRNRVLTHQGPVMVTVPVEKKGHMSKRFCDMKVADHAWAPKFIKTMRLNYKRAPFYDRYIDELEGLALIRHERLADQNVVLISWLAGKMGIATPIIRASEQQFEGSGSALVLDMCLKLKATQYLFGKAGRDYAKVDKFRAAGVEPLFQDYQHPVYRQHVSGPFTSNMSALDLLFNCGPDSREVILTGNFRRT